MLSHEQKVNKIVRQLKNHDPSKPVSLKKKAVSHQVPRASDQRYSDKKIDISDLTEIISIDPIDKTCTAESGVTFADLVDATLLHGLVPIIVPELKTITIGGAVAGCSIESMSYKYGGFHDTCLEYEVITAKGEALICTPDNENSLLFQMMHGTFGTLGILSKLKFKLISAQPFVKVVYEKYDNLDDYKKAIWKRYKSQDVDFMDGIIHSPTEYVLSLGNFVIKAPYTHAYDWTRVYYQSTKRRSEDYLKTPDYFFRYENGVTNVSFNNSFLGRLLFGKLANSTNVLWLAEKFRRFIPERKIPITVDTFIPFTKMNEFMVWYAHKVNHFPLWCVPYKAIKYEWIADDFLDPQEELFLDIAIYGMKKKDNTNYYKLIEDELMRVRGLKTLISGNYYSEEDFWKIWNQPNYDKVKQQTDPDNIFRDLYIKTCKTMMGLGIS